VPKDLVNDLYPAIAAEAHTRTTDVQTSCLDLIGRAQKDLIQALGFARMDWLKTHYTLATVASQQDYNFSSGGSLISNLDDRSILGLYPSWRLDPLVNRDYTYLLQLDPAGTLAENYPVRWAWKADTRQTIRVQPTPSDAWNIEVPYFRVMTFAASGDTGDVDWPDDHIGFLIEHVVYMAKKQNRRIIPRDQEALHQGAKRSFLSVACWRPPVAHLRPRGGRGLRA